MQTQPCSITIVKCTHLIQTWILHKIINLSISSISSIRWKHIMHKGSFISLSICLKLRMMILVWLGYYHIFYTKIIAAWDIKMILMDLRILETHIIFMIYIWINIAKTLLSFNLWLHGHNIIVLIIWILLLMMLILWIYWICLPIVLIIIMQRLLILIYQNIKVIILSTCAWYKCFLCSVLLHLK